MRKFNIFIALLIAVFAFNGAAFGWGTTGGDGSRYSQLQETAVFFNNAGTTLLQGDVVVFDRTGTGVSAGTTLGAYVKHTTTVDDPAVAGIVLSTSSLDQTPVVVVTKGPAKAKARDSSDPVYAGSQVGSSTIGGKIGGGNHLGYALEAGDGTDTGTLYIWVNPSYTEQ